MLIYKYIDPQKVNLNKAQIFNSQSEWGMNNTDGEIIILYEIRKVKN